MLYGSIDKITTATGNTHDAGGGLLTFEVLREMLDKIEWTLDENGELSTVAPGKPERTPSPTL